MFDSRLVSVSRQVGAIFSYVRETTPTTDRAKGDSNHQMPYMMLSASILKPVASKGILIHLVPSHPFC